jgi:serine/threonine protein kinase
VLKTVSRTCDRFEEAWRHSRRPSIEAFLQGADPHLRSFLLSELVVQEVELRQNAGEVPAMSEYTRRFPGDRALIRWALLEHVVPYQGPFRLEEFAGYRILERLGTGGMSLVFKAEDSRTGRLVALKVLAPALARDQEAVERFEVEIAIASRLRHHNLATLLDSGEFDGLRYLATAYVEGASVKRLLQRHRRLGLAEAAELARRAAEGLHALHSQGVIHRDIKPSNILLASHGEVVVMDFGLARAVVPDEPIGRNREEGATLGTFDYMAPEQWDDPAGADEKSDVYSLGCTLYHLLTGQPPFAGPAHAAVHQKQAGHRDETPPSLEHVRPDVPEPFHRILERMLAKDPAARFATALDLANALEPFARGADLRMLLAATRE